MWTAMGGVGVNVHFTNKAFLVKLSTKGEGSQKSPKNGTTWFVHGPLFKS